MKMVNERIMKLFCEMAVAVFTSHKNNTTMKEPVEKEEK